MLNLHRVLFCTGIDLDDIMQIDYLAYNYFVFIAFYWLITTFWYCVVSDYRGTPPPPKQHNLHLSENRISKIDNY